MPGVADWQQRKVTWEQGPIRALVSTVRSTPVIPVRVHLSNPRANPYQFKPPLFRQAVRGHHAPDRFLKKKFWTGGIRKRRQSPQHCSRDRPPDTICLHGELIRMADIGPGGGGGGGGGGLSRNSPWR